MSAALPVVDLEVDGVKYKLRRFGGWDALRFDAAAGRMLGSVLRALAVSDNAKDLLGALVGADKDQEKADRLQALLEADVGAALGMLGLGIDEMMDRLDVEVLIDLTKRMFVGKLTAPRLGHPVEIDNDETYDEVIGLLMVEHGHMHQLKLLWAGLRANLGPTSAGSRSSTTTPKASLKA